MAKKIKAQLGQLGMGTLVAGLKTLENTVSKKQYKRMIATAVAQLLAMHPDFGSGKAIRRARKIVGAKPAKKMLVKSGKAGMKEALGTAAAAAVSGAALKVAGKVGRKLTERVNEAVGAGASTTGASQRDENNDRHSDDSER
jgi:hypothetical protein